MSKKEVVDPEGHEYKTEYTAWVSKRKYGYGVECVATGNVTKEQAIAATKPYVHLGETWVEERLTRTVYRGERKPVCV